MKQSFAEAVHISWLLQVDFDTILRNILGKCYSLPGVPLVLGAFLEQTKIGYLKFDELTSIALLHPLDTLQGTDFSKIMAIYFNNSISKSALFWCLRLESATWQAEASSL